MSLVLKLIAEGELWKQSALCAKQPRWWIDRFLDPFKPDVIEAPAKKLCEACPVQSECLEYALAYEGDVPASGRRMIAGGKTPKERKQIAERRKGKDTTDYKPKPGRVSCECGCARWFDPQLNMNGTQRGTYDDSRLGPRRYATKECLWKVEGAKSRLPKAKAICPWCGSQFNPYTREDGQQTRNRRQFDKAECRVAYRVEQADKLRDKSRGSA